MNVSLIILVAIVLFLVFKAYPFYQRLQQQKLILQHLNHLSNHQITFYGHPVDSGFSIAVSDPLKTLYLMKSGDETLCIPYAHLIDFEFVMDGYSYQYSQLGNVASRSILGNWIGGSTGALIGAVTAKRREQYVTQSIVLKLICKETAQPFYPITFLNFNVKKGSRHDQMVTSTVQHWDAVFTKIMHQNTKLPENTSLDLSEEIERLNALYQRGILTQTEFEAAKQKILHL